MAELWHDPTDTKEYWERRFKQEREFRAWKMSIPSRLAFFLRKFI